MIKHFKVEGKVDILYGVKEFQSAAAVEIKENIMAEVQEEGIKMLKG